jgi:DNA polymerase III epsilon subunit-like protein
VTDLWASPTNLRLVVIDIETCVGPKNKHRVLSVGVAVARGVGVMERTEIYANPDCEVDAFTQSKHHITTAHVRNEPPLNEVWPEIAKHFIGRPGETVVLAAHYSAFDIPVLRDELARTGGGLLPDLPVIDTAGLLCSLAGLRTTKRNLKAVLAELGIANARPHNALSDATATAEAARMLIDRAMSTGLTDLGALLTATGAENPTKVSPSGPRVVRPRKSRAVVRVRLPDEHITAHAHAADADFPALAAACAAHRCAALAGSAQMLSGPASRTALFTLVERLAAKPDVAGVATALGALAPLLKDMPTSLVAARRERADLAQHGGGVGGRAVAVAVASVLTTITARLSRCPEDDPCPDCREARPCPLDTWPDGLVPLAITVGSERAVTSFWNPKSATEQGWRVMAPHAPVLADRVLRVCLDWWEPDRTGGLVKVIGQAWAAGCRDPKLAETRIVAMVRAGREADLRVALAEAAPVLAAHRGSTDPAVASLAVRAAQVEGRLARLTQPGSRHARLATARRPPRPPRFLRDVVLALDAPSGDRAAD